MKRFLGLFLVVVLVLGFGSVAKAQDDSWIKDQDPFFTLIVAGLMNDSIQLNQDIRLDNVIGSGAFLWNRYRELNNHRPITINMFDYNDDLEIFFQEKDYRHFNFTNVSFSWVDMRGSDFSFTNLTGSHFAGVFRETRWERAYVENTTFSGTQLGTSGESSLQKSYINFIGNIRKSSVIFTDVRFDNSTFLNSNVSLIFKSCSFANVVLDGHFMAQSVFYECVNLYRGLMENSVRITRVNNGLPELSLLEENQASKIINLESYASELKELVTEGPETNLKFIDLEENQKTLISGSDRVVYSFLARSNNGSYLDKIDFWVIAEDLAIDDYKLYAYRDRDFTQLIEPTGSPYKESSFSFIGQQADVEIPEGDIFSAGDVISILTDANGPDINGRPSFTLSPNKTVYFQLVANVSNVVTSQSRLRVSLYDASPQMLEMITLNP